MHQTGWDWHPKGVWKWIFPGGGDENGYPEDSGAFRTVERAFSFAPSGLRYGSAAYPRLAPWAALFRRFAAGERGDRVRLWDVSRSGTIGRGADSGTV